MSRDQAPAAEVAALAAEKARIAALAVGQNMQQRHTLWLGPVLAVGA